MIAVPQSSEHWIPKAKRHDVLHHLFTKVVIDPEDLALFPIRLKLFVKLQRALQIVTERLLNLTQHVKEALFTSERCKAHNNLRVPFFRVAISP